MGGLVVKWLCLVLLCAACGDDGGKTRDDAGVDASDPDLTAPSVVSVTPLADATGVAPAGTVTVTFSESMDPASLASAISLSPTTASAVTWDEATLTATVTPSTPLHRAATYTLAVSNEATDRAGNALAAAHSSRFVVEAAAPVRIDTGGKAIPHEPEVTFDTAGNGVAIWLSERNTRTRDLYYATYTATTATWSTEVELAHDLDNNLTVVLASNGTLIMLLVNEDRDPLTTYSFRYDTASTAWIVGDGVELTDDADEARLVSNGTTFLATWAESEVVHAALHDGTATWAASAPVSTGSNLLETSIRVASDGDAYAVAWLQRPGSIYLPHLAVYEGSAWTAAASIAENGVTTAAQSLDVAGAADGSGFVAVWGQQPPSLANEIIYAARWLRSSGTGALQPAERLSPTTVGAFTPAAAAGANGAYAVTWRSTDGHIQFAVWSGSAWSAPEQVTTTTSVLLDRPLIARVGPRYAVVWLDENTGQLYGRVRNAGAWEAVTLLTTSGHETTAYRLAASNGFGVAHLDRPAGVAIATIVRTLYTAGAWGSATVVSTATLGVDDPFLAPGGGNNFAIAWPQDGTVAVRAGANLHSLVTTPPPSHADLIGTSASGGSTLVTWEQSNGVQTALYGSVFLPATGWTAPVPLKGDASSFETSTRAGTFTVQHRSTARFFNGSAWSDVPAPAASFYYENAAANSAVHMLTHQEHDEGTPTGFFYRTTSDGTWSAPAAMPYEDTTASAVRLVPGTTGFLQLWIYNGALHAATFNGTAWSAPVALDPIYSNTPAVAASDSGYLVAWVGYDNSVVAYRVFATIFDGTSWSTAAPLGTVTDGDQVVAASNGTGYALLSRGLTTQTLTAYVYTGTWSSPVTLDSAVNSPYLPALVSDGTDYVAAWPETDELSYARWDAGTWSATASMGRDNAWLLGAGPGATRIGSTGADAKLHVRALGVGGLGAETVFDPMGEIRDRLPVPWNGFSFAITWAREVLADTDGIYGTGAF